MPLAPQPPRLLSAAQASEHGTQVIVLVTDGLPGDFCVGGVGGDSVPQMAALTEQVDRAAGSGIGTYVVRMSADNTVVNDYLDELARHGDPGNASARALAPASTDELAAGLRDLVARASAVPCTP